MSWHTLLKTCYIFILCDDPPNLTLHSPGYGEKGERLVAGIVPLSSDKTQVLLISSTRRTKWVLPKGGWEADEPTEEEAAKREAWEEAGIEVTVSRDLGHIEEKRHKEQFTTEAPKASYRFFEATVDILLDEWPEGYKRQRKWMSYVQAEQALVDRPELLEALRRCTMKRT